MDDLISRQMAIDAVADSIQHVFVEYRDVAVRMLEKVPSAEPVIIHCKDCKYGNQDEDGWWFCSNLGCQMGEKDGSGFCSDAERRTNG